MMTLAVPSKSASPVTPSVLEAVIVVAATAPVTLPVTAPTKPLVEVTGPEKVVELIGKSSHASYGAYLSACRQSGNCQIHRMTPVQLLYTISDISTQYLNKKKTRLWERVKSQGKQKKNKQSISCSLRNCSTPNISLNSVLVNILYPPHEHIFAKGVFHGIYPSSD
jgi:hypothetical protein